MRRTTWTTLLWLAAAGALGQAPRRAVFENKQHDFPQRILYWLDAKGALRARIEEPQGGKTASEEWVWTKSR